MNELEQIQKVDKLVREHFKKLTVADLDSIMDYSDGTVEGDARVVSVLSGISFDDIKKMSLYDYRVLYMVCGKVWSELRMRDNKISHFKRMREPMYKNMNDSSISGFLYDFYRVEPTMGLQRAINLLPGLIHRLDSRVVIANDVFGKYKNKIK